MLPIIVDAQTLSNFLGEANEKKIIILDLSSPELYGAGHLPGALFFNSADLLAGEKPVPGLLPTIDQLAHSLAAVGYSPDAHIIVYDHQGGPWAGRFIWTLDCIGHKGGASLLTGGAHAWEAAGYALSQTVETPVATVVTLVEYDIAYIADAEYITQRIGQEGFKIWDARSPAEFTGEKVLAARGGHIPGAINIEWTTLLNADLTLKPLAECAQIMNDYGLSVDDEIVTHCQTHRRSGLTYAVMKALSFPHIKAYPGSWSQWGNLSDTPVEQ